MTTVAERIQSAMQNKGVTPGQVGKGLGYSSSQVIQWMEGARSPTIESTLKLAKILDVSPHWLVFGDGPASLSLHEKMDNGGFVIPEVSLQFIGKETRADELRRWWVNSLYLKDIHAKPESTVLIEIQDDSMHPTLAEGDKAFVDRSRTAPYPPGIFALWYNNEVTCSRLRPIDKSNETLIECSHDNSFHRSVVVDLPSLHIIGKVLGVIKRL